MATTADLRPCNVSLVRVPLGRNGAAINVEKRVAPSIRRIDGRYKADPRSAGYPIRPGDTGAYNCRRIGGSSSWSKHAYGAAVDINWHTNGFNAKSYDLPAWYIALWKAEGWGWGGDWRSVKDWMHFSKFPNEGGDGKLEDASTPAPAPSPSPSPKPVPGGSGDDVIYAWLTPENKYTRERFIGTIRKGEVVLFTDHDFADVRVATGVATDFYIHSDPPQHTVGKELAVRVPHGKHVRLELRSRSGGPVHGLSVRLEGNHNHPCGVTVYQ